jgi:hypothetical protein
LFEVLLAKLASRLDGRDGDLTRPNKLLRRERRDRIEGKEVSDSMVCAGLIDGLSEGNVVGLDCEVEGKLKSWTLEWWWWWWSSGG